MIQSKKQWVLKGDRKVKTDETRAIKIGKKHYLSDNLIFIDGSYHVKKSYHLFGLKDGKKQWFRAGANTIKVGSQHLYDYTELLNKKKLYLDRNGEVTFSNKSSRNQRPPYNKFDVRLYGENGNPGFATVQKLYDEQKDTDCQYAPYLKDYTFGVEYETSLGFLPEFFCEKSALLPVRDGSLPNGSLEYISPVMSGEVNTIRKQCAWLSRFCSTDFNTSTHIHIGNLPQTPEFLVAFYMLYERLQEEIQNISPNCKKDVPTLAKKERAKDHCKFLPQLGLKYLFDFIKDGEINESEVKRAYNEIWTWANDGVPPSSDYNPKNRRHVKDGRDKWHFLSRYHIISLIPFLFENKRTIEFRYHYGTTNSTRIINWLLICIAIIEYAKNNTFKILEQKEKINLLEVVDGLGDESLSDYLRIYIKDTCKQVISDNRSNQVCGLIDRDQEEIKEWTKTTA